MKAYGTLKKKIQRQPTVEESPPPRTGPKAVPNPARAPIMPRTFGRSVGVVEFEMTDIMAGNINPAPRP